MNRRDFLLRAALTGGGLLLYGCGREGEGLVIPKGLLAGATVTLYDTYAQSLYMDGGLGPKTGIIKVDYVLANKDVTLQFWHGHGGKQHQYTVTPAHFDELKKLRRVYVTTTVVADHDHRLFIEPVEPKWRVPGAKPVQVPVGPTGRLA